MDNSVNPVVGQWYRHPDGEKGAIFRVIDIDAEEDTVEVQHFDGDIEEMPQGAWQSEHLQNCAAPEDWTGPYDEIERDDRGYSDSEPGRGERRGATEDMQSDAGDVQDDSADDDDVDE